MLKNLKSLFIVEDDKPKAAPAKDSLKKETNNNTSKKTKNKPVTTNATPLNADTSGTVDQTIVEKLLSAIEKNNLEGFDYLEYKKSLKALEKMPMDEATKYRSAFATASTMGVTLEKLLNTVRFYIGVLDKENEQFVGTFKNQFTDKVANKEKEITQFEGIIKEKAEKIKQLTEEIARHQDQIADLKVKLEEGKLKINQTQSNFTESYTLLKSQFEEDIVKMHQYLK